MHFSPALNHYSSLCILFLHPQCSSSAAFARFQNFRIWSKCLPPNMASLQNYPIEMLQQSCTCMMECSQRILPFCANICIRAPFPSNWLRSSTVWQHHKAFNSYISILNVSQSTAELQKSSSDFRVPLPNLPCFLFADSIEGGDSIIPMHGNESKMFTSTKRHP